MGLLGGRRALVTGGAAGIGLATARRMVGAGARVALVDVDGDAVQAAASELDGVGLVADVGDGEALAAAFEGAAAALGGIDTLFNNAGGGNLKRLDRYSTEEFEGLLRVNLTGTWNGTRLAIPLLRAAGGGVIVNNASVSALRPTHGEAPYSAAKAAVVALTQSAALEYGPDIRVNCVSPGIVRSNLTEGLFRMPGALDAALAATPLGRTPTAEEIADVVVFLCSERSRAMTGQNLVLDGGLSLPQAGIDPLLKSLVERMEG